MKNNVKIIIRKIRRAASLILMFFVLAFMEFTSRSLLSRNMIDDFKIDEDYELIDENLILKKIEKELGENFRIKNSEDKKTPARNVEDKKDLLMRRIKVKFCSGKTIEGLTLLSQKYISLAEKKDSEIGKSFSQIPSSFIRRIEITSREKLFDKNGKIYYFPEGCSVFLNGKAGLTGVCEWMNWLKITVYTSGKIQNLYTYYSEHISEEKAENRKYKKNKKYNKKEVLCSIELAEAEKNQEDGL